MSFFNQTRDALRLPFREDLLCVGSHKIILLAKGFQLSVESSLAFASFLHYYVTFLTNGNPNQNQS